MMAKKKKKTMTQAKKVPIKKPKSAPKVIYEKPKEDPTGTKDLLIMIAAIIIIFAVFLAFVVASKVIFKPKVTTMEQVIEKTLEGEENIDTNILYNGFVFIKVANLWQTTWVRGNVEYTLMLHYNPKELLDIPVTGTIDDSFSKPYIYITFDPLGEELSYVALSNSELSLSLIRALNIEPRISCDKNATEACWSKEVITCDNTDEPVIYFITDPEVGLELDNNCIRVKGSGLDLVRATERIIYQWYGIMQ